MTTKESAMPNVYRYQPIPLATGRQTMKTQAVDRQHTGSKPWSMARGLAAALLLALCAPAWAATYTVNSTADTDDGSCDAADCTLREAINAANASAGVADTIDFDLSGCPCTINLTSTIPLESAESLTINGPGAGNLTIKGRLLSTFARTPRGNLVVRGLTFGKGGYPAIRYDGNDGSVVVEDSVFDSTGIVLEAPLAVRSSAFLGQVHAQALTSNAVEGRTNTIEISNCTFNLDASASSPTSTATTTVVMLSRVNATITNSTFFNNRSDFGGTIKIIASNVTITNSTIASNQNAPDNGDISSFSSSVTLRNSIVTNSAGGQLCYSATFVDGGGNLFSDDGATCGYSDPSSRINANAGLDPSGLQDNGGPVPTLALLAPSDAIDAGVDSICADAPVNNLDQRGVARPSGAHCDSGAFELDVTPDPFSFAPVTGAPLNSLQTSSTTVTVAGLDNGVSVPVSVSGDAGFAYSKNGGLFTSVAGTVSNGDQLQIQVKASSSYSIVTSATLNIGGVAGSFTVTTQASPGVVQLSSANYSVNENAGSLVITLTRTGGSRGGASVKLATSNLLAKAGSDYTAVNTIVNWADGDAAAKTVSIPILRDRRIECDQTFQVTLSNASGASLGSPATARVVIKEDDLPAIVCKIIGRLL